MLQLSSLQREQQREHHRELLKLKQCAERASETEQAVGRIVGALCAITARDDDAESAMLASWISQV